MRSSLACTCVEILETGRSIMLNDPNLGHTSTVEDIIKSLDSTQSTGLDSKEVNKRRAKYGLNKLDEPEEEPWWHLFLSQFNDPLIYMLMIASVISAFLGEWGDAIFIWIVLTANSVFGYWMESNAEQAMQALKDMTIAKCMVVRNGSESIIESEMLVPGDLVKITAGMNVPADIRLIEAGRLRADESALTGESEPVDKTCVPVETKALVHERTCILHMGTNIVNGRGLGLVYLTGMSTQLGQIAGGVAAAEMPKTPLEVKLGSLGKFLAVVAAVIAILLVVIEAMWSLLGDGTGDLKRVLFDNLLVAVAIFVAIVPEGLPIILIITLALGMRNMARHKAIIRRMKAVETLGSTTVICTDKTGTLTMNQMTVRKVSLNGEIFKLDHEGMSAQLTRAEQTLSDEEQAEILSTDSASSLLRCASLCHSASLGINDHQEWGGIGDPTDVACALLGARLSDVHDEDVKNYPKIIEHPFDSDRKCMSTAHKLKDSDNILILVKGALSELVPHITSMRTPEGDVPYTAEHVASVHAMHEKMARAALRVLAFCERSIPKKSIDLSNAEEVETNLTLIGIVGIMDPPRPEVPDAIAECQQAGIDVKMITGDTRLTAEAIAKEVGIVQPGEKTISLTGQELADMSDEELDVVIADVDVFSRVTPSQKSRIVERLQKRGEVVAMTGDGVNDATALSLSNIGIAMGISGTDVARDAADMVLQDDNFANIVRAVEEGRKVYQNIRNFVRYQISTNVAAVGIIFLTAFVFRWPLPLTATQILVINILMDGPPAVALGMEKNHGPVMNRPPRPVKEGLPSQFDTALILFLGGVMMLGTVLIYYSVSFHDGFTDLSKEDVAPARAMTATFTVFILFQLFNVMNCRSNTESVLGLGLFSNRAINYSLVICLGLLFLCIEGANIPLVGELTIGSFLNTTHLEAANLWVLLFATAGIVLVIEEFRKMWARNDWLGTRPD